VMPGAGVGDFRRPRLDGPRTSREPRRKPPKGQGVAFSGPPGGLVRANLWPRHFDLERGSWAGGYTLKLELPTPTDLLVVADSVGAASTRWRG
jgi:hypothetical protein